MQQRIAVLTLLTLTIPATAEARGRNAHRPAKAQKKIDEKTQAAIDALKKIAISDFDWRTDALATGSDGYFASAIDAVLKLSPRELDNHFAQNADGTLKVDDKARLDVFFYEKQPSGKFTKTTVKLDGHLLLGPNNEPLVKPFGGRPMLPVLQRAYAEFREGQGFHAIKGGVRVADDTYADALMEALVGRPAEKPIVLKATPPYADELFNKVSQAASEGRGMVAATPFGAQDIQGRVKDAVWTGLTNPAQVADLTLASIGLMPGRAYTLFDAKRVMVSDDDIARGKAAKQLSDEDVQNDAGNKSVRYVYLRSPSIEHDAASVTSRGMFRVPLRKFQILCDRVYIGPRVVDSASTAQASR